MNKYIAIYPHNIDEEYINNIKNSLKLAHSYGFDGLFSSIHLPEYSLDSQLKALEIISEINNDYHFELTVDVGGHFIDEILNDKKIIDRLNKCQIDFFRLDYGYSFMQIKQLYDCLKVKGFVINASMYDEKQVEERISELRSIDSEIEIRACHNFYVRKESGLDEGFALRQDSYFRKHDIPVYYFVPSHTNPRGPLHEGLCTIEKHRYMEIDDVIRELYLQYGADAFIMADEWISEAENLKIKRVLDEIDNEEEYQIRVSFVKGVTEKEKKIVLGKHIFRYDSPVDMLRSRSSRQMAEFADRVEPNNTIERIRGSITIDNQLYKRYSGEMQVLLNDFEADERVNVIGYVNKEDINKLLYFRKGRSYDFIEDQDKREG